MAKTIVVFRKWRQKDGGDVIALFPGEPGTNDPYTCSSYQHVGQHGAADPLLVHDTLPAKPEEYAALKLELERIGYELEVRRRITSDMLDKRRAELARMDAVRSAVTAVLTPGE